VISPAQISDSQAEIHALHTQIHRARDLFPGQRENETVRLYISRHWIVIFKIFLNFLLLSLVLPSIFFGFFTWLKIDPFILSWLTLFFLIYLIFIWLYTYIELLKIELSVLIITNDRIVDIFQTSLFDRQVSETNLSKIQDVLGFTHGVLGTFLDVGALEIQTAGKDIAFTVRNIKSPHLTARKILEVQREGSQQRRGSDTTSRREGELFKRANETLSDEEILQLRGVNPEKTEKTGKLRASEGDQI
jgi:hypothetical protein